MIKILSINKTILAILMTIFLISACHSIPQITPQERKIIHLSDEQQNKLGAARNKLNTAGEEYGKVMGGLHGEPNFTAIYGWVPTVIQDGNGQPEVIEWRNPDNGNHICDDGENQSTCTGKCPC